jgi:type I restriction enzyme S subunit
VDIPFWTVDTLFFTEIGDSLVPKFLYYFLLTQRLEEMNQAGGIPSLTQSALNPLRIPVPPLEVQQEIVRILDFFTELEDELQAELEARRRQYTYYRGRLLNLPESATKRTTLGSICTKVSSGGTPSSGRADYYNGDIPWLRTQEVDSGEIWSTGMTITEKGLRNSSAKWIPANCVIVAMYGATAAKVAINAIPLTTNQACCNLQVDPSQAEFRYVFHWIANEYERLKALGEGSQSNLNAQKVKDYPISIPPLEDQRKIVAILDTFDAMVSDPHIGIPAELVARGSQYEYYRDRLLTFEEWVT